VPATPVLLAEAKWLCFSSIRVEMPRVHSASGEVGLFLTFSEKRGDAL
jgi:hypothetical protein